MENFAKFFRYAREYGPINALVYSIVWLFPRFFRLALSLSGSQYISSIDYKKSIAGVIDYKPWPVGLPHPSHEKTFVWFAPDWLNVWGGGHFTLFRFADHFARRGGGRQIIYIYNNRRHKDAQRLQADLDGVFKDNVLEVVIDAKELPAAAAAFATTWQSAYDVRAFPFAEKKFYFMQDYEGLFYAYGTGSMQANNTYEFGFAGITGGTWLRQCYESHGGRAQNYIFAADKGIFYPAAPEVRPEVKRIFFYGRPSTERRCFELGMASLARIAEEFPEVEIVIAGLDLKASPPFKATLLGNMSLAKTGDLYRTCDIGIAFSATNLSYLPVELMASGVPVITNKGPQTEWFCTRENACVVDPVPDAILGAFRNLYNDRTLRQRLSDAGLAKTGLTSWEAEADKIYDYVEAELQR